MSLYVTKWFAARDVDNGTQGDAACLVVISADNTRGSIYRAAAALLDFGVVSEREPTGWKEFTFWIPEPPRSKLGACLVVEIPVCCSVEEARREYPKLSALVKEALRKGAR